MALHAKWVRGNLVFYDGAQHVVSIPQALTLSNPELVPNVTRLGLQYAAEYVDHFMTFSEDEWTVVLTDAGVDGAEVHELADEHGGVLQLSTNNADEDETGVQSDAEHILLSDADGFDTWFAAMFKVDDVDKAEINIGLMISDAKIGQHHTAGGGVNEGVYVRSPHDDATLHGECVSGGGAAGQVADIATLEDDTWIWAGFHYNPTDNEVQFAVNGENVGDPFDTAADIPNAEELATTFAVQTGEAVIHTLKVHAVRILTQIPNLGF